MRVTCVGGPAHEQAFTLRDDWPIGMPWRVAERPEFAVASVLDMPLNAFSLELTQAVIHDYYLARLGGTDRVYLRHDPQRCGCTVTR